jgi:hypothetical protein
MRVVLGIVVVGIALAGPGCAEATVSGPTAVGNNVTLTVETFSGTLPVGGSRFYSFTVPQTGSTTATLLSLKQDGVDSTAIVLIGLGAPRGTECLLIDGRQVSVDVVAQVSLSPDPGIYCARISDAGNLTGPVEFSINIVRPR